MRNYVTLQQAIDQHIQCQGRALVDIIAVVADWKDVPRLSRGSDYVANLYLVDESIAGRDRLELMLFSKFSSHLPGVKESGDIIRLRDVRVQAHQGKPQLYGKIDRTSSFRFSVFHHKTIPYIPGVDLDVPYLSPEQPFYPSKLEIPILARLRDFSARRPWVVTAAPAGPPRHSARAPPPPLQQQAPQRAIPTAAGGASGYGQMGNLAPNGSSVLCSVSELSMEAVKDTPSPVDIICMILALDTRENGMVVAHIWDGTDLPPLPPTLNKESAYASSLLGSEDRRRRYRDLPLSSTTDATSLSQMMAALDSGAAGAAYVANARTCMPTIGSAVPLLLPWSRLVPLGPKTVEALSVGAWVKLKMVTPIVTKGGVQLLLGPRGYVSPREGENVGGIVANYRARLVSGVVSSHAPVDPKGFVSKCKFPKSPQQHEDQPVCSVRTLLSNIHDGISGTFRVHVRVVEFMPRDIRTALVPLSDVLRLPKEETSPAAALCGHTYALWLRLEDATGQIPAVLLGMDAEEFFHGLPPFDPSNEMAGLQALDKWTSWLVSEPKVGAAEGHVKGGRWLDCCIKLAYMDTRQVAVATDDGSYRSPIIRIVQTEGRAPS